MRVAIQVWLSICVVAMSGGRVLGAQTPARPTGTAGSRVAVTATVPRGCPTPTGVARAVSPGDVAVTTLDDPADSPTKPATAGRTVFYATQPPASASDTGGRTTSGRSTGATVRTRAGGEVAGSAAGSGTKPGTASGTAARPVAAHAARPRARPWTVQVASYETFDQAQAMQATLCGRGYEARIIGAVRPYVVRVGRYNTSDSAIAVARHLTGRHLTVFVTPAEGQ